MVVSAGPETHQLDSRTACVPDEGAYDRAAESEAPRSGMRSHFVKSGNPIEYWRRLSAPAAHRADTCLPIHDRQSCVARSDICDDLPNPLAGFRIRGWFNKPDRAPAFHNGPEQGVDSAVNICLSSPNPSNMNGMRIIGVAVPFVALFAVGCSARIRLHRCVNERCDGIPVTI